jgi:hypothetical protein
MSYLVNYLNESVRSPRQELEGLKTANGFTDADLESNRAGRIGPGQMTRLFNAILGPLLRSFLILAGSLTLLMLALGNFRIRSLAGIVFLEGAVILAISCAGAFLIAGITTTRKTIGLIGDALAGTAGMIEGRVYASEEPRPGTPWGAVREQWTRIPQEKPKTYRYAIRDVAIEVSYAGFRALASGGHYKLYYTPRSKLLLSIEPSLCYLET